MIEHNAFRPGWLASTPRFFALCRALEPLGWQTTLVGGRRNLLKRHPRIEQAFPGEWVMTRFPIGPWPRAVDYPYVRNLWIMAQRSRGNGDLIDDPETQWAPRLERWARDRAERDGPPDVVWGITYADLRSPVAARRVSERLGVPLVFEFHDPCPYPGYELRPAEVRALERTLLHASAIVTTTSTYASWLSDRYPEVADRVHVVYSSAPPVPPHLLAQGGRGASGSDGRLTLLHTGTLYGGGARNARSLVAALPFLFDRRPEAKGRVKLRLVGSGPGMAEAKMESKRAAVAEEVCTEPPVRPERIWRDMLDADCLVLIKHADPRFASQIPGKLFQYFAMKKPILTLAPEGETAEIVRRSGLGLVAPPDAPHEIADRLVDLWDAKTDGRSLVTPAHSYIDQFSEANMGLRVAAFLDELVG